MEDDEGWIGGGALLPTVPDPPVPLLLLAMPYADMLLPLRGTCAAAARPSVLLALSGEDDAGCGKRGPAVDSSRRLWRRSMVA